jgi:hypothetical protein
VKQAGVLVYKKHSQRITWCANSLFTSRWSLRWSRNYLPFLPFGSLNVDKVHSKYILLYIVQTLSAAHIAHTRPDQESNQVTLTNKITQRILAIIHKTLYGTLIPYIKINLLGSNDEWQYKHATVTAASK